jgi:hypothetical protein
VKYQVSHPYKTSCSSEKRTAKKSIGNNLDGYNLQRHKLRKRTIRLGTLNVQGIRYKTGKIVRGFQIMLLNVIVRIRNDLVGVNLAWAARPKFDSHQRLEFFSHP